MGASATTACQPESGPLKPGQCGRQEVCIGCHKQCLKEDMRELRNFQEIKSLPDEPPMGSGQRQRAQQVVDLAAKRLMLGVPVRFGRALEEALLSASSQLETLEIQVTKEDSGDVQIQRAPMVQIVNSSNTGSCLFLHFSDAMSKEPWKITFASETECLSFALTLRVLRARLA